MMNELEQRIADDTNHTEKSMIQNGLDNMEKGLNTIEKAVNRLIDLSSRSHRLNYWSCINCSANCRLSIQSASNVLPFDCIKVTNRTASWTQIELDGWK